MITRRELLALASLYASSEIISPPLSNSSNLSMEKPEVLVFESQSELLNYVQSTSIAHNSILLTKSYYGDSCNGANIYLTCEFDPASIYDNISLINVPDNVTLKLLNPSPNIYNYGAKGDGTHDDSIAFYRILKKNSPTALIDLGSDKNARFVLKQTVVFDSMDDITIVGSGTILRESTSLHSNTKFQPLLKFINCKCVNLSGNWCVDGNRDAQKYQNTHSLKRGKFYLRHNGDIEIGPLRVDSERQNVTISISSMSNSFLNALVIWNVFNTTISNVNFTNCTWNGISGAGTSNVRIVNCTFIRCGNSPELTTEFNQGDRAGIQFRELPRFFDPKSEGIDTASSVNIDTGAINSQLEIDNNRFTSCGVESVYVRAGFQVKVCNNISIDCGYMRLHKSQRYRPAHIWLESGEYTVTNNLIEQRLNNRRSDWMVPDGMRITTLSGDASEFFPKRGNFTSTITNNTISTSSHSDVPLIYNAIRTNGNCIISFLVVKGTESCAIWVQNSDSFKDETPPKEFLLFSSTFVNTATLSNVPKAIVHVTKFGTVKGKTSNIQIKHILKPDNLDDIYYNPNLT